MSKKLESAIGTTPRRMIQEFYPRGGLSKGFHIGYQPHLATARAASYNLLSCIEHPQVVEQKNAD